MPAFSTIGLMLSTRPQMSARLGLPDTAAHDEWVQATVPRC